MGTRAAACLVALLLDRDQRNRKREIGRGRNEREEVREGRKRRMKEVQDKDLCGGTELGRAGGEQARSCGRKREEKGVSGSGMVNK